MLCIKTSISNNDNGIVRAFTGDGNSATEKLIECYVVYIELSGKYGVHHP
ncbi:MAG: hypothetical protein K8F52_11585 [Candidatus Scalindua rubra]|nr:hypothetical protein [Candidatus Scalindua rubra]